METKKEGKTDSQLGGGPFQVETRQYLDPFFTVNLLYKMVQLFYFSTMVFKVAIFVSFRVQYIVYLNQSQLFQKNNHGTHNKW